MANGVYKENFTGKFNGVASPLLLPPGSIGGGKNVRRASVAGGWKARKGSLLHNALPMEGGGEVRSLHLYENPLQGDVGFVAQCEGKLLKAAKIPLESGLAFGTELKDVAGLSLAGAQKGFSDQVSEWWFYADGSGRPVAYGGNTPFPRAVVNFDASENDYVDYTRVLKDSRNDTCATLIAGQTTDGLFVLTQERASGILLEFGSPVNAVSTTIYVQAMRSGTLTTVSGFSDGTSNGGKPFAQSGTLTWTASALDTPAYVGGYFGYIYRVAWLAPLTSGIQIISLRVIQPAARMTNKWHGVAEYPSGCRFWNAATGEFVESLGKITNESTSQYIDMSSATTSDYLYVKTPEPAFGFGLAPVQGYANTAASLIDLIEVLQGDSWTSVGSLNDTTRDSAGDSSFAQAGVVTFDQSTLNPTMRTNKGDSFPGYWYRISWSAALSGAVRLYMVVYMTAPLELPTYDGCVEFKGRLVLWGDPEFPNRMRLSQFDRPFCFTGLDAGYSEALGYADKILAAKRFYSELIIWKKSSIFLLEGYNMATFGSARVTSTLGIASPKTAQVVEAGYSAIHADEPMMIALWQAVDGVYAFDGRKPRKISGPVDNFFNPEYPECISANDITLLDSFIDHANNEYHLLLPNGTELVYNYLNDEWYPLWERRIPLSCGIFLRSWNSTSGLFEHYHTYGGSTNGFVLRLEVGSSDRTTDNAEASIEHFIKTRAIAVDQERGLLLKFTLRRVFVEARAKSSGVLTTTLYVDRAVTGSECRTPTELSLISNGYDLAFPRLDFSHTQLKCFELRFLLDRVDQELEIYGIVYEIEAQGLPGI